MMLVARSVIVPKSQDTEKKKSHFPHMTKRLTLHENMGENTQIEGPTMIGLDNESFSRADFVLPSTL